MRPLSAHFARPLLVLLVAFAVACTSLFVFPHQQAEAATKNLVVDSVTSSNLIGTFTMHTTESVTITQITIKRTSGTFSSTNLNLRQLTVNGQTVQNAQFAGEGTNTATITIPGGVSVSAGAPIVLRWTVGYSVPEANEVSATAQAQDIPAQRPQVLDPTAPGRFKKIINYRDEQDAYSFTNGVLMARTWWGPNNDNDNIGREIAKQGSTKVIQVEIEGASNLENTINVADPRLELQVGFRYKPNGPWYKDRILRANQDYTVSVSGNSVYFTLNTPVERDFSDYRFVWEARIPYSGTATHAELYMWNEGPSWYNRNAPALNKNEPETPREQLKWLSPSTPNPAVPARCGGNIALLFDLSGSVTSVRGQGSIAQAGADVLNALSGTGSKMSLYNFASAADTFPAATITSLLSVDDLSANGGRTQLQTAINAVASFGGGNQRRPDTNQLGQEVRGSGTNWEAAFKQIPSNTYDTVIFVTDGVPTTNDDDYPLGFDSGELINAKDLDRGVEAANVLKAGGTRIETIMVGIPSYNEYIPKDNFFNYLNYRAASQVQKDATKIEWGYPALFAGKPAEKVPDLLAGGGGFSIWLNGQGTGIEYNVTNQPNIWRAGVRSSNSMAADVSSLDAVHNVDNYESLAQELRDLVLHGCEAAVTVEKIERDYVNSDGSDQPGSGWQFTASDVQNSVPTITATLEGAAPNGTKTGRTAGDPAEISFPVSFSNPNGNASMTITETQQEGWTLVRQGTGGTDNAKCIDLNDPNVTIFIQNVGATGFRVSGITEDSRIRCTVINERRQQDARVLLQKRDANDAFAQLDAGFVIYPLTQAGKIDNSSPIKASTAGDTYGQFSVKQARYAIVETQAPKGYSLLPRPIFFEIVTEPSGTGQSSQKIYLLEEDEGATGTFHRVSGLSAALVKLQDGASPNPPANQQGAFSDANGMFTIQIFDVRTGTLPKTGGVGVMPIVLGGVGVAALAVLSTRRSRKG